MARIYLAKAGGIGAFERYVVLKTISPDRANDQRFVTMFLDEARLAATLNHQNIAQVYEVDEADGNLFITMEYVHGENLRHILETTLRKGWTIPIELAVMIVSSAAAGLHHAHERKGKNGQPLNIVHRDVSPANIMVGYDGSVKLLDFGIAKAEERSTKTQQGTIKGKYGYMSPEQCRGKPIDRRSDIFALGIILYEITTLRRAFRGNDDFDTMKRIVNGDLVPPSVAVQGYPRELEAIVLTAMARDPDFRFQTTQEMLEALDAFMVRAKIAGSPSAMARFMTQLFGSKREPWVEAAPRSQRITGGHNTERTELTGGPEPDSSAEATAVIEDSERNATLRDVEVDSATTQPTRAVGDTLKPDAIAWVPPRTARPSQPQDAAAWNPPSDPPQRRSGPIPSGPERASAQRPMSSATTEETPAPERAEWAERAERAKRESDRIERPRATQRGTAPEVALRAPGSPSSPPAPTGNLAPPRARPSAPDLALDPNEPVPSVRPKRTAMWILIVVLVAVIAVVAGSIALGLMANSGAGNGSETTTAPAPAPASGTAGASGSAGSGS